MTNSFKALSALLTYPTEELKVVVGEIRDVIFAEALAPRWALDQLTTLLREIETLDLYELQERYVFLFDRTRSLSLHLFEHVHGESRDRGQAMVDLRSLYEEAGLDPDARELPDFLPMFLEYLSTRPIDEARSLLAEPLTVIAALKERLARRKTPYAAVLRVLDQLDDVAFEMRFGADDADLDAAGVQFLQIVVNVETQKPHEVVDLGARALPVFGRKSVERQIFDAEIGGGAHRGADGRDAGAMTHDARQ